MNDPKGLYQFGNQCLCRNDPLTYFRSSHRSCSVKKTPEACNSTKTQLLSCETCEILENMCERLLLSFRANVSIYFIAFWQEHCHQIGKRSSEKQGQPLWHGSFLVKSYHYNLQVYYKMSYRNYFLGILNFSWEPIFRSTCKISQSTIRPASLIWTHNLNWTHVCLQVTLLPG